VFIINEAIKKLDGRSKEIILKKFGIGIDFPMSTYSLSKEYDISITKVDSIIRDSIGIMRTSLKKLNIKYEEE
jgi:DNA-directed RNA polymerase sigma subunit (sigma70/sigma32)